MWVIVPTALILTTISYTGLLCIWRVPWSSSALDHITNFWIQRILAACFIAYGILLGLAARLKHEKQECMKMSEFPTTARVVIIGGGALLAHPVFITWPKWAGATAFFLKKMN